MTRRAGLPICLFLSVLLVTSAACLPSSTPEVVTKAPTPTRTLVTPTRTSVVPTQTSAPPTPTLAPPTSTKRSAQPTGSPPTSTPKPATPAAVQTEPGQPTPTQTSVQPTQTSVQPAPTSIPPTQTAMLPTTEPSPTPTDTPEPSDNSFAAGGAVQIYETSLTIPTYGYEAAFQPTTPDDPIYPYPRVDPGSVTPPEPRTYQAIVIENDYVSLTVLPELGGRIYRWIDKSTGRHLLYENPVIKPTQWGYRGWWLGAGGIEWAFPVEEHGLNEWRPWSYTIGHTARGASITVSDVEDRTGMSVGATVTLDADHSYVTITPWVKNVTDTQQHYQYWLNAMLALGDNHVSPSTRIILPADHVIVHSTGDASLPGAWQPMSWPVYGGRDLSKLGTWTNYLGFFVPQVSAGFVGLYDEAADQGIVRCFTPGSPAGTKFFGPGTLPPYLWTDDDSTYVELWSGITPTFADNTTLQPGASVAWSERWYPIHGIGSLQVANASAAINLAEANGTVTVGANVTGATAGTLSLYAGGQEVKTWNLALLPGEAFRDSLSRQSAGALGLALRTAAGETVVQMGSVP